MAPDGWDPAEAPRRGITLTRRAAILASAVCAVVLLLAYPLREYASQRSEINSLREQSAAATQQVAALTEQQRRWQDSAYIRAQARQRLHYVMPGETAYVVVRGGSTPAPTASSTPPEKLPAMRGATPGG
jgi:cell division protein FtsB